MVKYGNIIELMTSIAEAGYSDAEPLLVVQEKEIYIVVEGNRRLSAIKLLNHPELTKMRAQTIKGIISNAKYIPNEIPCILYPTRKDVLDYLGYRHITGVKDWGGALEKARYLDQLYQIHIEDTPPQQIYRRLANIIGSRADYVLKLHLALKLYERANENAYYGADIQDEDIKFSWLTTALGHSAITDYIGISNASDICLDTLEEENFKKIFQWMFHPNKSVVGEVRKISDLAKVIEYPNALAQLEKGGTLEEALLHTSAPSESFIKMLRKAKQQLQQAKDAIEQLNEEPLEAKELLESMEKLIKTISGGLEANFNRNEVNLDILQQLAGDPATLARLKKMLGE